MRINLTESFVGEIVTSAPSNIAITKYWGKKNPEFYGPQIPANTSISMALKNSVTAMKLKYSFAVTDKSHFQLHFKFEGKENLLFKEKFQKFIEEIWIKEVEIKSKIENLSEIMSAMTFEIETENSFPHSAGIASSASSFAALNLCLKSFLENILVKSGNEFKISPQELSNWARLASGSASRSVGMKWALWGEHCDVNNSSNHFAIDLESSINLHPLFKSLKNTIIVVDSKRKSVSSRHGHELMNQHPFAGARFEWAQNQNKKLLTAFESGDFNKFSEVCEMECLMLHGLMMTSQPQVLLLKGKTLDVINLVKDFRQIHDVPITFTLDAGPNLHLLYPDEKFIFEKLKLIESFIIEKLKPLSEDSLIIWDQCRE